MRKNTIIALVSFPGVLAVSAVVASGSTSHAADECLAAPSSSAPPGSHWYYRLERSTERKCWYMAADDREVHVASSKVQPKSSAGFTANTDTQVKGSRQAERGHARPAGISDMHRPVSLVLQKSEPVALATSLGTAAEEQPTSAKQSGFSPLPTASLPVVIHRWPSGFVVQEPVPGSSDSLKENVLNVSLVHTRSSISNSAGTGALPEIPGDIPGRVPNRAGNAFTPLRLFLLLSASLALTGIVALVVFPPRLQRQPYHRRRLLSWGQEDMPRGFRGAIPEANLPAPLVDRSNGFKQNLRQVLQTMEAQLKGDAELAPEALPGRSNRLALSLG